MIAILRSGLTCAAVLAAALFFSPAASAQAQFPDTVDRSSVPGVVPMCLNSSGQAIPVSGSCANPAIVTPQYSRPLILAGNVTPGTTYSAGQNIGGLLTVTPLGVGPNGTLKLMNVRILVTATAVTTLPNINIVIFNAAPSTTFTDGAVPTFNTADDAKFQYYNSVANNNTLFTGAGVSTTAVASPVTLQTDAGGNIYVAFSVAGAMSLSTPNKLTYTIEADY